MSNETKYQKHKALLLAKKANGCEDCGFNAHPAALDLDHIDPDTKRVTQSGRRPNPGSMLSYSTENFVAELAKCRVLCKNCHAIHTVHQQEALRRAGLARKRGRNFIRPVIMSEGNAKVEVC